MGERREEVHVKTTGLLGVDVVGVDACQEAGAAVG